MWNSLTFGSWPAPASSSSPSWSSPWSTLSGGGSMIWSGSTSQYHLSSSHSRDTVHIKRLTSGKIFREGLKEVKRTAFSTPVMSRKNSLDTQSYRRKFSTEDLDQDGRKGKVSVSSLVGELSGLNDKMFNISHSNPTSWGSPLLWRPLCTRALNQTIPSLSMFPSSRR